MKHVEEMIGDSLQVLLTVLSTGLSAFLVGFPFTVKYLDAAFYLPVFSAVVGTTSLVSAWAVWTTVGVFRDGLHA